MAHAIPGRRKGPQDSNKSLGPGFDGLPAGLLRMQADIRREGLRDGVPGRKIQKFF
jgi:hypothetical protein